ncbi:MAG: hypothetical protein ABF293_01520 [Flavobacteriaceae bacterium]
MKNILLYIAVILFLFSCKPEKKKPAEKQEENLSVIDKIASAHGYDNWSKVRELRFTFNIDRDTSHFHRSWRWKISDQQVIHISATDTITYYRTSIDSTLFDIDARFINDKYWLLAPFNLVWDQDNFTYSLESSVMAPVSKENMQKLTIVYGNEGGYTPGDAYDFYFGDDYLIREWVFRKSNQAEASLSTTWEEYKNVGGLELSTSHKVEDASWHLYFSGLEVN